MTNPIPRLVIRIDNAPDPIAGELVAPDQAPRRFTGWLQLVGLIEQSRAERLAPARRSGEAAPGEPGGGKLS